MNGQFKCAPLVCEACGRALDEALKSARWGQATEGLPEPVRECVREYLRGLRVRAAAAESAKAERLETERRVGRG